MSNDWYLHPFYKLPSAFVYTFLCGPPWDSGMKEQRCRGVMCPRLVHRRHTARADAVGSTLGVCPPQVGLQRVSERIGVVDCHVRRPSRLPCVRTYMQALCHVTPWSGQSISPPHGLWAGCMTCFGQWSMGEVRVCQLRAEVSGDISRFHPFVFQWFIIEVHTLGSCRLFSLGGVVLEQTCGTDQNLPGSLEPGWGEGGSCLVCKNLRRCQ